MCRGFQPNEPRECLKIKAFYLHFSFSTTRDKVLLPDSLTLHFLPRINGGFLEINGSSIRPDTSGFITMHRVVSPEKMMTHGVVYGSREKMKASQGSMFEIYMGDVKLLKGVFRKDEGENWELECKCGLEEDELDFLKEANVGVAVEGQERMMNETVEMRKRRRKRRARCFQGLEEIPEEREGVLELEPAEEDGGCLCDECSGSGMVVEDSGDLEVEVETEGVKWAVDVGIWVVCLGFGYLVTKASRRKFRNTRLF